MNYICMTIAFMALAVIGFTLLGAMLGILPVQPASLGIAAAAIVGGTAATFIED